MSQRLQHHGMHTATAPRFLSHLSPRFGTPSYALVLQLIITSALVFFDFEHIVSFEMWTNCTSLTLEFITFIRLKYTEPHLFRPFSVPYGLCGAWAITFIKAGVVFPTMVGIAFSNLYIIILGLSLDVVVIGVYLFKRHFGDGRDDFVALEDEPDLSGLDHR